MKRIITMLIVVAVATLSSCRTIGVAREKGGYAIVSSPVANEMVLDHRQVIVIDFQTPERFTSETGHIAGAISAPLQSIESMLPELIAYANNTILVYGSDKAEGISGARILVAAGFKNVILIDGGIDEWRKRGFKTVSSAG